MNRHKAGRRISVALVGAVQALFLFMILRENTHSNVISIAVILLSLLLLVAHVRLPLHHQEHLYEHILVAAFIPVGAVIAYSINNTMHLGPVIAAGIVGTAGSFVPVLYKRSAYLQQLPPAIYCGAFIGMCSPRVANGFLFVVAAGIFAGVLLVASKSLFQGMGGKLGLIAFAGVVVTSLFLFVLSHYVLL